MFSQEFDFDEFSEGARKEAGFVVGYAKIFKAAFNTGSPADDADLAEGLKITKRANNLRANIYRYMGERKLLQEKLLFIAQDAKKGNQADPEVLAGIEKEIEDLEDKVLVQAHGVLRLRTPLDDYLVEVDIPVRSKYNRKDGILGYEDE